MANSVNQVDPPKPKPLTPAQMRKIKRAAKRDAKKNTDLRDSTRTHSIHLYETESNFGDAAVNEWLTKSASPYIAGNARIDAEARLLCDKIGLQKTDMGETGRQRKAASKNLESLQQEMADLKSQFSSNREIGFALIRQAEEVKPLWENLYREKTAYYLQTKLAYSKFNDVSAPAEVPVYRALPLATLEQFDREFAIQEEC